MSSVSSVFSLSAMGGSLGCHRSIPKDPTDVWSRRKFSAACSFSHVTVHQERLNINTATEEELMTLPGVGRTVAQNIVEYRRCIGGFKKIQDLALVSGVGADKVEAIKLEICVSSRSSSSQHSPSSVRNDSHGLIHSPNAKDCSCQTSNGLIHGLKDSHGLIHGPNAQDQDCQTSNRLSYGLNTNSATAAELVGVAGLTQNITSDIITFRKENGSFETMEDLLRVHSVDSSLLEKIYLHLHAQRPRATSSITSPTACSETEDQDLPPGGPAQIPWFRPNVDLLPGLKDLRPTLRLASWSLQSCSIEKATNPGVRAVLCMTLLENSVSLLAVQDVLGPEALEKFCAELNQGSLSCFHRWKSPRGVWKSVVSDRPTRLSTNQRKSFCGFMWDASSGVDLKETAILESAVANSNESDKRPGLYSAVFTVGNNKLRIINVHLPPANEEGGADHAYDANRANGGANGEARRLLSILQNTVRGEEELLVVGDFGVSPQASELELLRTEKMSALLPSTQFTDISTSSPQGTRCLDNIWISQGIHTGRCVVVREGLTNPWIPDGWSWGGVASDHCPITVELYLDTRPKAPPLYRPGVTVDRCEAQDKLER